MTRHHPIITCADCGRERPHAARGCCSGCYSRRRLNGDVTQPAPPPPARKRTTCKTDGCRKPAETRGWCNRHYRRETVVTCPDCGQTKPHGGRGLCSGCYRRGRRADTLLDGAPDPRPAVTRVRLATDWRDDAACAADRRGWARLEMAGDIDAQLAICRACPVRAACLTEALATESSDPTLNTVRGGMTPQQLAAAVRKARRAA